MRQYALQAGGINSQAAFCARAEALVAPPSQVPSPEVVPIGSVEWTREYADACGIQLRKLSTYPDRLRDFLLRDVRMGAFEDAQPHEFVKPISCKAFTGGIRSSIIEEVDPDEGCWISSPVEFLAEWRCYILEGKLAGIARYDDGDNEAEPDMVVVYAMIDAWKDSAPAGWSLDVGLLPLGSTALVEVNDGWALGYYTGGTCTRQAYLDVITARWDEAVRQSTMVAG